MRSIPATLTGLAIVLMAGCHQAKAPHAATDADMETARLEAQREVADARTEASKDVKSAAKVSNADPAVVAEAKVTAKYDVDMAKADGDHKIALEKCLTLAADVQNACHVRADADYDAAKAAAKATRLAKRQ